MRTETVINNGIRIIFLVGITLALLGFGGQEIDSFLSSWIIPIFVSFVTSAIIGDWIESISGDFFNDRQLSFPIEAFGKEFFINIPLMTVIVLLIKIFLGI